MNGVEILAMEEVAVKFAFNIEFAIVSFIIAICISLIIGVIFSLINDDLFRMITCLIAGACVGLFVSIIVGFGSPTATAYETHYKATISDEVNLNEFLDKYEIIDQESKIYTIREKIENK